MQCVLQVPRFYLHPAAEAYFEMRCWLPYCVQEIDDARRILVGRDYKPVGMVQREEHVNYKDFPHLEVRISERELAKLSPPDEIRFSAHLYSPGPWDSRTNARLYLGRLVRLRQWLVQNGR